MPFLFCATDIKDPSNLLLQDLYLRKSCVISSVGVFFLSTSYINMFLAVCQAFFCKLICFYPFTPSRHSQPLQNPDVIPHIKAKDRKLTRISDFYSLYLILRFSYSIEQCVSAGIISAPSVFRVLSRGENRM
jgi:hypothetical protein